MRIRSLEIQGFKSFGEKAVFGFDRGISAIVGPNGCGKSNVVDAIRWVMGEQNPRHLRGRAMEDIIFSGTESKSAVGVAEVVMTLDNSDNLAQPPYDGFSEIQIARRLYRSGESEYLINKTPCRLRDITDFFLDTGVGTRGYTIVEQGKIAEIVSTKPEERRVIFEEAAGIGKYRQRRRETERKLQSTEQNLLRVTDILGELRRQIGSLDRQARKAKRYRELSAKVRELELSVTWKELQGDQTRVREAESELELARSAGVELDARVARSDADLETERRQHLELEREVQSRNERLFELRSEIQSFENRITYERRERSDLLRLSEERAEEIAAFEEQERTYQASLQDVVRLFTELQARLDQESGAVEEREAGLRRQTERRAELQGRREAGQARLVQLAAEAATLESRCENLDERRREAELRLRESEEALEQSANQVEDIRRDEENLEGKLRSALSEQDQLGRTVADLLRRHGEARVALDAAQLELNQAREALQEMRGRLEVQLDAEKRESLRVAQALAVLPSDERSRVLGVLGEVMRVEDGYEAALEAVLGSRLEAVLVEDVDTALDFLGVLRREKAGRATALPLSVAPPDREDGIIPIGRPLREHVIVEARHRPLVDRLLRNVLLVDDLREAVDRFGATGLPAVFVTEAGEVLDRSGALTGGSGAPAGALSRQAEVRRLQQGIEQSERDIETLELAGVRAEALAQELESELENSRSRRHTAELAVVNLDKDLERSRERSKEAVENAEQYRSGKRDLLEAIEGLAGEREDGVSRLEAIAAERAETESARDRLGQEITTLQRELEGVEQRLVQARVDLAELGARRDQQQEARTRLEVQVAEARDWLLKRREEVSRAQARSASLEASTAEAEGTLAARIRDEEAFRGAQEAERERYEQGSRRVENLEQEAKAAVRLREETRERISKAELAVQEVRMRRDQVCERILDRYGIDLRTYQPEPEYLEGDAATRDEELRRLRQSLDSMGEVHLGAIEEYEEVSERHRYLGEQKADLEESMEKLKSAIARINRTSRARFRETFEQINDEFKQRFPRMFRGGRALLTLTETEDVLDSGIEITAQPPGKKLQNVNLLSGGEKAMTAIALLFSVFSVKPSPFFLLDEVDAALDEANVGRFDDMLREIATDSQFLVITHNKASIENADKLFGVTMQEPGLSRLVTVDLVS